MRVRSFMVTAGALALSLGACSPSPPKRDSASSRVAVKMFGFTPSPLPVREGQSVRWTNHDEILHTATSGRPDSPNGVFDGTMDGEGRTFTFTFDTVGSYPYFCSRHNGMRGEIVVRAG